jgi:hypothetical protein
MTDELDFVTATVAPKKKRDLWTYLALAILALAMVLSATALAMRTTPGPQGRSGQVGVTGR